MPIQNKQRAKHITQIWNKAKTHDRIFTFALPDRKHALLVAVAKGPLCSRFKVPGVHSAAGNRVAALTHARVVPQAALV